jgi:hypothetical protein
VDPDPHGSGTFCWSNPEREVSDPDPCQSLKLDGKLAGKIAKKNIKK